MRNNQILLAAIETIEGEAESLTGSNVIETVDGITWEFYAGDKNVRNVDSPTPSPGKEVNINPHQSVSFNVDAAGSGDNTKEPSYSGLLQACGFKISAAGDGGFNYTLSDETSKTVTLARYLGGELLQETAGARGQVTLSLQNKIPQFQFSSFVGSYIKPKSGAFPDSIVYDNYADPLPLSKDNTTVCDLGGNNLVLSSGSITFGSGATFLDRPFRKGTVHGDQFATAQLTVRAGDISTEDWFTKMESHTGNISLLPFNLSHGPEHNQIKLSSTSVQISNVSETDQDGEVAWQLDLRFMTPPLLTIK